MIRCQGFPFEPRKSIITNEVGRDLLICCLSKRFAESHLIYTEALDEIENIKVVILQKSRVFVEWTIWHPHPLLHKRQKFFEASTESIEKQSLEAADKKTNILIAGPMTSRHNIS